MPASGNTCMDPESHDLGDIVAQISLALFGTGDMHVFPHEKDHVPRVYSVVVLRTRPGSKRQVSKREVHIIHISKYF